MDEDRRIRFLVAPVLFLFSLGWGMWWDPVWHEKVMGILTPGGTEKEIGQAIAILAGGSIIVFTFGVVIGTTTYVLLRTVWLVCCCKSNGGRTHEACVTACALVSIWKKLLVSGKPDRSQELFAVVSFEYGVMYKSNNGVHLWIVRRWNAFSIAVTSITGLAYSLIIGRFFGVHC